MNNVDAATEARYANQAILRKVAACAGLVQGRHRAAWGGICMNNDLYWDPQNDDGDALRLAAALDISLELDASIEIGFDGHDGEYAKGVEAWVVMFDSTAATLKSQELYGKDKCAAIRKVIWQVAVAVTEHKVEHRAK